MRQRIVVGVSGSPGSLAALHRAVIEAQERDADLCAVLAWQLPGGGLGSRTAHGPDLLRECEEAAVGDLCAVLSGAFAVARPCVPLSALAMRGEPGQYSSKPPSQPTTSWSWVRAHAADGSPG